MASRLPLASLLAWVTAVLIGVAPALLAADHGGVLPRSQWIASLVALLAVLLAIPVTFARQRAVGLRPHFVAIVLLLAAAWSLFQMTPLPGRLVTALSAGSAAAYQDWLLPLSLPAIDSEATSASFPISIAPWLTGTRVAGLVVIAAFAWVASTVFTSRQRIQMLMLLVLATGTLHAGFGFYQLLHDPTANVWGVEGLEGGSPFGAFTNRNNSAVLINLGLGCAIGLLAWRLSALTGYQLSGQKIPAHAFTDLLTDRTAVLALIGGVLCGAGLIASGSRGGLAGGIAGGLLAFGLVASLRRGRGLVGLTVGIALITAVLMIRFELPHETLDRLGATGDGINQSIASDGRLDHWPDGARAAKAYLPAGSGAGTYRFAYLPYQQSSSQSWFVNADNLWLEWLVEMGVVGIGLLALFLLVTGTALQNVNFSPDPLDHGLATAGWFALGAIAVTQFFDFGLSLLPVGAMAAILFSAVIGRSRALRAGTTLLPAWVWRVLPQPKADPAAFQSQTRWIDRRGAAALALGGLAVALVFAQSTLAQRTASDRLQRRHRQLMAADTTEVEAWETLINDYRTHLADAPHDATGQLRMGEAELFLNRLRAAAATAPNLASIPARLAELSPTNLRRQWYRRMEGRPPESPGPSVPNSPDTSPPLRLDLSLNETDSDPETATSLSSSEARRPPRGEPVSGEPVSGEPVSGEPVSSEPVSGELASGERGEPSDPQEPESTPPESEADETDRLATQPTPQGLPVPLLPIDSEVAIMLEGVGQVPDFFGPSLFRVRQAMIRALRAYPLADESRYLLARLDFAGGSPKQSRELLVQLASLRRQNGDSLRQVGQAAATAQMWDLAASVWKRALQVAPGETAAILAAVDASPVLRPSDVVPVSVSTMTAAARLEIRKATPDQALLEQAVKILSNQPAGDRQTQRERLELLAKIESKRGQHAAAAEHYGQVVAFSPGDADARYRYAQTLAAAGDIDAARQQTRTGRQLAPEDARFDRLLEELARAEIR